MAMDPQMLEYYKRLLGGQGQPGGQTPNTIPRLPSGEAFQNGMGPSVGRPEQIKPAIGWGPMPGLPDPAGTGMQLPPGVLGTLGNLPGAAQPPAGPTWGSPGGGYQGGGGMQPGLPGGYQKPPTSQNEPYPMPGQRPNPGDTSVGPWGGSVGNDPGPKPGIPPGGGIQKPPFQPPPNVIKPGLPPGGGISTGPKFGPPPGGGISTGPKVGVPPGGGMQKPPMKTAPAPERPGMTTGGADEWNAKRNLRKQNRPPVGSGGRKW